MEILLALCCLFFTYYVLVLLLLMLFKFNHNILKLRTDGEERQNHNLFIDQKAQNSLYKILMM